LAQPLPPVAGRPPLAELVPTKPRREKAHDKPHEKPHENSQPPPLPPPTPFKIVLFACPKGPSRTETSSNEQAALGSWVLMSPPPDYVVLVSEQGSGVEQMVAYASNLVRQRGAQRPQLMLSALTSADVVYVDGHLAGPKVSSIFELVEATVAGSSADVFMYTNSDILLPSNFVLLCQHMMDAPKLKRATTVITGMRWNCPALDPSDSRTKRLYSDLLSPSDEPRASRFAASLAELVGSEHCRPAGPMAKDYFVYKRGFWQGIGWRIPNYDASLPTMPPFALGRFAWDNYMCTVARKRSRLIDASAVVSALHLYHDYRHFQPADGGPGHTADSATHAPASAVACQSNSCTRKAAGHAIVMTRSTAQSQKMAAYNSNLSSFYYARVIRGAISDLLDVSKVGIHGAPVVACPHQSGARRCFDLDASHVYLIALTCKPGSATCLLPGGRLVPMTSGRTLWNPFMNSCEAAARSHALCSNLTSSDGGEESDKMSAFEALEAAKAKRHNAESALRDAEAGLAAAYAAYKQTESAVTASGGLRGE